MNEGRMTEERSDQKFDEAQCREAAVSKEEVRVRLTSIRDELVGNSGAANDDESANSSTDADSTVHTPPPTVTSFEAESDSEQTDISYTSIDGSTVPAALEPANKKMTRGRRKSEEISDVPEYREAVNAMENGDVKAKTKVAFYKLTGLGGVEIDEDEAVVLLEERAKDGDGEARWMLGLCYEYGIGTEQDIERAESLYRQSNEGGNAVGFLLRNAQSERGSGVMKVGLSL